MLGATSWRIVALHALGRWDEALADLSRAERALQESELTTPHLYVEPSSVPVEVRYRRFAPGYTKDPQTSVPEGSRLLITFPPDASGAHWIVATRSKSPYVVCAGF